MTDDERKKFEMMRDYLKTIGVTFAEPSNVVIDINNYGQPLIATQSFQIYAQLTGFASSYFWGFGDGQTSTEQSPAHAYAEPGVYPITLTVSNAYGSASTTIEAEVAAYVPPPAPVVSIDINSVDHLTVSFFGHIGDATEYHWDFGDGTPPTSQFGLSSYTYAQPGTYTLKLTTSNQYGTTEHSQEVTVSDV